MCESSVLNDQCCLADRLRGGQGSPERAAIQGPSQEAGRGEEAPESQHPLLRVVDGAHDVGQPASSDLNQLRIELQGTVHVEGVEDVRAGERSVVGPESSLEPVLTGCMIVQLPLHGVAARFRFEIGACDEANSRLRHVTV